ncbi:uncharacterized protein LOC114366057, partial [Ostrinia furnacalis]|uniref:uncharacterized protein LOC114366057 n=1 Tax=Ostrinia furnacalis TaxID=93504 RepID=UPI001038C447
MSSLLVGFVKHFRRKKRVKMSGVSRDAPVGVQCLQSLSGSLFPRLQFNRLLLYQSCVLMLTFFTYMTYHLTRKPISVVKSVLHRNCSGFVPPPGVDPADDNWCDWPPFNTTDANTLLGALDSAFLFSYAGAMFVSDWSYIAHLELLPYRKQRTVFKMASMGFGQNCIERLKGAENYSTWKFSMRMVLIHEELWDCVEAVADEDNKKKDDKALARIALSVAPTIIPHIRTAK